jgi:hypothetical protein
VALEGSLRDFGLADILQLIFFQRKTGVLLLEGRMDKIKVLFIQGNIAGAESRRRTEANRIGKVLVKKGLLREEDLQPILEEQAGSNEKLGCVLVKKGIIDRKEMTDILTGQIRETVIQIFGWKEGTYEFTPQQIPKDTDIPVSLDTQHLLMEGLRIVDEWSLIDGKVTLDAVFVKKTEDGSSLTEEEREIFPLIDGENDVSTIIDITGQDDFSISKTLVSLLEKDLIERREILPVIAETPPVDVRRHSFPYALLTGVAFLLALLVSLYPLFLAEHDYLPRLQASRDVEDLRYRVEAYRFQHGLYPERLDMVSSVPDPWGNLYAYDFRDSTFLVSSAGQDGQKGTSDDIY